MKDLDISCFLTYGSSRKARFQFLSGRMLSSFSLLVMAGSSFEINQ